MLVTTSFLVCAYYRKGNPGSQANNLHDSRVRQDGVFAGAAWNFRPESRVLLAGVLGLPADTGKPFRAAAPSVAAIQAMIV
jgi:hypothetical protein